IAATIIAIAALAPLAIADPAGHRHDYLATLRRERVSAIPPDLRDHAEIKQFDRLYGNPFVTSALTSSSSFNWSAAGIGAGAAAAVVVLLGGAAVLVLRRRTRIAI